MRIIAETPQTTRPISMTNEVAIFASTTCCRQRLSRLRKAEFSGPRTIVPLPLMLRRQTIAWFTSTLFGNAMTRRFSFGSINFLVQATPNSTRTRRPPFLILLCVCLSSFVAPAAWAKHPNIILMMADDMGMGDTSAYQDFTGNGDDVQVHTPNMERLARMGVRCTDAHTPDFPLYGDAIRIAYRSVSMANSTKALGAIWCTRRSAYRTPSANARYHIAVQGIPYGDCGEVACWSAFSTNRWQSSIRLGRRRFKLATFDVGEKPRF